jgi:hypothetical protein
MNGTDAGDREPFPFQASACYFSAVTTDTLNRSAVP